MLCYVVVFETLYVLQAVLDTLFASVSAREGAADGLGECVGIVGMDVEAVGSSGFFKTRTRSSYDGQPALYGFDDGYAKAFVA